MPEIVIQSVFESYAELLGGDYPTMFQFLRRAMIGTSDPCEYNKKITEFFALYFISRAEINISEETCKCLKKNLGFTQSCEEPEEEEPREEEDEEPMLFSIDDNEEYYKNRGLFASPDDARDLIEQN